MPKDKKAAKGDKPAKAAKGDKASKGDKKEKVAKGEKKEKAEKAEKPKKEKAGDAGAAPVAAAAAPANGTTSPYGYGGMGGGLFPRVGPFAPSSAAASYFGGGGAIYGAGAGGGPLFGGASGHPYLRATAAGSPLLGLPSARYGPAVTSSGSLLPQHGGGSTEALLAGLPGSNAVALAQAYQTRMAALSTVAASLLSKREAAVHQLARVQSRMAEVSSAREAIESETLADTEAVLHRLRSSEAQKFASLSKDSESLVSDVGSIDAFYGALTSFQPQFAAGATANAPGSTDPAVLAGLYDPALALQFMRAYPELCAEADRLSVKSIKTDVDVPADDFEREIANRNELASRYAALLDLVAAKDRIILQLLKEREASVRERDAFRSGIERAAANRAVTAERQKQDEVEHWVSLADRLTDELNEVTDKLSRAKMAADEASTDVGVAAAASVANTPSALAGVARGGARSSLGGSRSGIAMPSGTSVSGGARRWTSDDEPSGGAATSDQRLAHPPSMNVRGVQELPINAADE